VRKPGGLTPNLLYNFFFFEVEISQGFLTYADFGRTTLAPTPTENIFPLSVLDIILGFTLLPSLTVFFVILLIVNKYNKNPV
jgi:hypothetical protein